MTMPVAIDDRVVYNEKNMFISGHKLGDTAVVTNIETGVVTVRWEEAEQVCCYFFLSRFTDGTFIVIGSSWDSEWELD